MQRLVIMDTTTRDITIYEVPDDADEAWVKETFEVSFDDTYWMLDVQTVSFDYKKWKTKGI